jgi:hypothetical protein
MSVIAFLLFAFTVAAAPSKRGLSAAHSLVHSATFCDDLAAAWASAALSWTYSWALSPPNVSCSALGNVSFDPMVWCVQSSLRNAHANLDANPHPLLRRKGERLRHAT